MPGPAPRSARWLRSLPFSRRSFLQLSAGALLAPRLIGRAGAEEAAPAAALAAGPSEVHGLSVFGDLALPPDFKAFDYVNIDAPKGGAVSSDVGGSFDSLNAYILRGDPVSGMDNVFDSLLKNSLDEHDALYSLVARSVRISPDRLTYQFLLRKEARFHDGSPLTAGDVAFSLDILKSKGHPRLRLLLRDMVSATPEADEILTVAFRPGRSRQVPLLVAGLPIFSSAWYSKRPFEETTLEPPLGSGPYKVGRFEQGRFVTYQRVPDYWAKDLPVNLGQNNFDLIRYDYFGDRAVAFEGFKAGAFTVHEEFKSATWATGYDFPAIRDGFVTRETIPDENISGIQGWFFNTRRAALRDPRVREAIGDCFDFAWTNKNLMYGSYQRTVSYFQNSDLAASGLPGPEELALLEPFRDKLPAGVFGEPFTPPQGDGSGSDRALLRRANALLIEAGCKRDGGALKLPDGAPFALEFLFDETGLVPHTQAFIDNLKQLGIDARIRIVDPAQYKARVDAFDFDIVTVRLIMAWSPGEELRDYFGSDSAAMRGSRNLAGINDPAVDALIAKAIAANSRAELAPVCRALDRVLRAGRYWVPHWYKASHWIAHWDLFGRPERAPRYSPGIESTWWYDDEKAKRIKFVSR